MNRLVGNDRFNPSDYPIDIYLSHSEESVKMFLVSVQVDSDYYIVLRDLQYIREDNPDNANITPISFQTSSLKTVALIREEGGMIKPDRISSMARRLGLRLVSPKDNRILLNNEMPAERKLTRDETSYLKETIRRRLDQVTG